MAFLIKLLQTTVLNISCFSLFKIKKQKQKTGWPVVVHAFNLSAWEAEAGRFLCYRSPSLYRVSNNQKRKKERKGNKKKSKGREGKKKEKKGKERKGKERKGKERKGKERKGKERKGKEKQSQAFTGLRTAGSTNCVQDHQEICSSCLCHPYSRRQRITSNTALN
jgi:hypothetical protein